MPTKCNENSFFKSTFNSSFILLILITIILLFTYLETIQRFFAQTSKDMYMEGYFDGCHDSSSSINKNNLSYVHISNISNLYFSYNDGYNNGLSDGFLNTCSINILSPYFETYNDHQKFYNSDGESMSPIIHIKDLLFIDNNSSNFNKLKNGDIIIFKVADPTMHNQTIVHRVIHIFQKGNTLEGNSTFTNLCNPMINPKISPDRIIMTKGDANNCSIPLVDIPITKKNYFGKVISINGKKY